MITGAASVLSSLCGWTYFIAWSASFYPQLVLNQKRSSVQGLSLNFVALNVTGFCAYALFTILLYFLPAASSAFLATRGIPPQVPVNDVVFAVHGAVICLIIVLQCVVFPRDKQRVHPAVVVSCSAFWTVIILGGLDASLGSFPWPAYLDLCGAIKVLCSFGKYVPQVVSNHAGKSTTGFAVSGMALDLVGGVFSLAQQAITATVMRSAAPFATNPAKTFLAAETLLFDLIFLYQHFVMYPRSARADGYGPLAYATDASDEETGKSSSASSSSVDTIASLHSLGPVASVEARRR